MSFTERYGKKLGVQTLLGYWNADTNTPTITSGVGGKNDYYIVSVNGDTEIDGINDWKVTDIIQFTGTTWIKKDNTDEVTINSPAFVGTPTAPTPDSTDNSTRIATTAFVKSVSAVGFIDGGSPVESEFDSGFIIDGGEEA